MIDLACEDIASVSVIDLQQLWLSLLLLVFCPFCGEGVFCSGGVTEPLEVRPTYLVARYP